MEIIYKKNAFIWNILLKYLILFLILFILIKITRYTFITLIGTIFLIFCASYFYRRTIKKIENILTWATKNIKVEKVCLIGNGSPESSSIIEYAEFLDNKDILQARNLETFFFPILNFEKNIMKDGLNLHEYQLNDLKVYINPDNKYECYFNDKIFYHKQVLKKVYLGSLIIFSIPLVNTFLKLILI